MRAIRFAAALVTVLCGALPAWAIDEGWPRQIKRDDAVLSYYQPQIDSWQDRKVLKARMAVVLAAPQYKQPLAGALWLKMDTAVDLDDRTVLANNVTVERVSFSVADQALAAKAEEAVKGIVPRGPLTISLDRILAGLEDKQQETRSLALKNDPPRIIVSQTPARLVIFDGEPAFAPIQGTNLQYVVNTNWALINEMATSDFYLLDDKSWLAASAIGGPWTAARKLPRGIAQLPNDDNWKDVKQAAAAFKPNLVDAQPPKIIVVTEPAELIVIDGKPQLAPAGPKTGKLQAVANTDVDLYFHGGDKNWYFLVAGRWFRSPSLDGPWSFASNALPPEFKNLPEKGKTERALFAVPGTPQAQEAVLVASIPQTATVNRAQAKPEIAYAGEPKFEPIPGTTMAYAANVNPAVIRVTPTSYYVVDRGVWFTAPSPTGPWTVATSVPPDIQAIPPSAPVYNYTYVTVEESTPETVTTSFTAGYLGGFVTAGLLYWGTGYYYPPYWGPGPVPAYYPRPYTYGAAAWYNPATNSYYRGGAVYGPYGGAGAAAAYNPATGTYARGAAAYGPYGGFKVGAAYNPATGAYARGAAGYGPNGAWRGGTAYNPQTGTRVAGAQGTNVYGSWGNAVVSRGDEWAKAGYRSTSQGTAAGVRTSQGTGAVGVQTSSGQTAGVVKGQNNTYVGNDGNVYRKTDTGWQKYDNGSWTSPQQPAPQRTASTQAATPQTARGSGAATRTAPSSTDISSALQGGSAAATPRVDRGAGAQQVQRGQYQQAGGGADYRSLDREYSNREAGARRDTSFQREYGGGGRGGGRGGRR